MFETIALPQLYAWLLVFCRVGSGIMVLPGIGEMYVAIRARLLFALAVSAVMSPVLAPSMPSLPDTPVALVSLLVSEITIGLFLGIASRVMISAVHMAGQIISMQASLSAAMMFDPTQAAQSTVLGNLFSVAAVVLIFAANLHHLMLSGLYDSYSLFPAGHWLSMGDAADSLARTMSGAFMAAFKFASPIIVFGLILYLGAGVLARLMPNLQIFFLLVPPQILLSFLLILFTFSATMLWYLDYLQQGLSLFFSGGSDG